MDKVTTVSVKVPLLVAVGTVDDHRGKVRVPAGKLASSTTVYNESAEAPIIIPNSTVPPETGVLRVVGWKSSNKNVKLKIAKNTLIYNTFNCWINFFYFFIKFIFGFVNTIRTTAFLVYVYIWYL